MDGYSLCQVDIKLATQSTPWQLDTQTHHITVASVTALRGKVSWWSGVKEYHKVIQQQTTNLTQEIDWERHKRVAASGQGRSSSELSRRHILYRISWGCRAFQGGLGLVVFCCLILRQSKGLLGFFHQAQGLVKIFGLIFFCRAELDHLSVKDLEMALMTIRVVWGQSLITCVYRGLQLLGHNVSFLFIPKILILITLQYKTVQLMKVLWSLFLNSNSWVQHLFKILKNIS